MKIIAVTMIKNESDMIESFCRYYMTFCDQLLIYDDNSSDDTRHIIESLIQEGFALVLADSRKFENVLGFQQSGIINELTERAFTELKADLVIPVDADELLFANSEGDINPREVLESLDENVEHRIMRLTFVYNSTALTDNSVFLPKYFTLCGGFTDLDYVGDACKTLVSKKLFMGRGLRISHGNHALIDMRKNEPYDGFKRTDELYYAHYPLRSVDQTMSKAVVGWVNQLIFSTADNISYHWREMYEKVKNEGRLSDSDVTDCIVKYYMPGATVTNGRVSLGELPVFQDCDITLKYTDYSLIQKNNIFNIIDNYEKNIIKLRDRIREKGGQ